MPDSKTPGPNPPRETSPPSRGPNSRAPASRAPDGPRPWRIEGVPNGQQAPDASAPKSPWRKAILWLVLSYLIFFGLATFEDGMRKAQSIAYTEFSAQVDKGNVTEIFSRGQTIQGTLKDPVVLPGPDKTQYTQFVTERPTFANDDLLAALKRTGAVVRATPVVQERGLLANLLVSLAPILLLGVFWVFMMRRQQSALGGLLGAGKRKPVDRDQVRVTFADVAGIDEVEAEISEIVDFLKEPAKYQKIGARPPKGVLLTGAPGTGKTLLARATAGEANVPFFSASASEFIEMIVGVGASRVRELFNEARKVAPAIIFIDEIDTIGRARGGARSVGGHDEREQTLNQILTEMDGFSGSEGVVVLAATNRPDVLDPALLRPGRFDRTITVHAPDQKGRLAILQVHTRKVPLAEDVVLEQVARITPGMTGAALANLVNEGALLAAKRGHERVTAQDFTDALEKVQLGTARNVVIPAPERRRTAYHEAGHALLGMLQPGADPVRKVSIIPRGRALGVTLSTPEADRYGYDTNYLRGRIIGALGGMASEAEVFGVITTGAESDLEMVTGIARSMVGRWGMSDKIGPLSWLPSEGDPRMFGASERTLATLDDEIRRIVDECYQEARRVLRENRPKLDAIVEQLLLHETLDEAAIYAAAQIERTRPDVHDPAPASSEGVGSFA
jgi:cell division protease FtsH